MPAVPRKSEDTSPGAAAWSLARTVLAENHVEGDMARQEAEAKVETLRSLEPEAVKERADSEEKARQMQEEAVLTKKQVNASQVPVDGYRCSFVHRTSGRVCGVREATTTAMHIGVKPSAGSSECTLCDGHFHLLSRENNGLHERGVTLKRV